jgi:hypothetical protein
MAVAKRANRYAVETLAQFLNADEADEADQADLSRKGRRSGCGKLFSLLIHADPPHPLHPRSKFPSAFEGSVARTLPHGPGFCL